MYEINEEQAVFLHEMSAKERRDMVVDPIHEKGLDLTFIYQKMC
jgi:hypothetical protein